MDVLKNSFGSEIAAIKREYYRICIELLEGLQAGAWAWSFPADRRAQLVWHDELESTPGTTRGSMAMPGTGA